MINRFVRCVFIAALLAATLGPASAVRLSAAPAVSGAPVEIPVVLSMTGYLAFLGQANAKALEALEGVVNKEGGINGRPVAFTVSDDQSNPQVSVQLASKLIAANAPVMLGPEIIAGCNAVYPLLKKGPVMYCIAPIFEPAANGFGFVADVSSFDQAVASLRYFREQGWTRIAMLSTQDAAGQTMDRAFDRAFALPKNQSLKLVDRESFSVSDIAVSGQLAKIRASNPQAVIAWTVGTPLGTVLRSMRDAGFDLPILAGSGNMTYAQMNQFASSLPSQLYFPAMRSLVTNGAGAGPIHDAQVVYQKALAARGIRADLSYAQVWGPAMILVDALRHIGPNGTADDARGYITKLHSFIGINGVYDFRDGSQRGLGLNATLIAKWDQARKDFVAVSKPSNSQ